MSEFYCLWCEIRGRNEGSLDGSVGCDCAEEIFYRRGPYEIAIRKAFALEYVSTAYYGFCEVVTGRDITSRSDGSSGV